MTASSRQPALASRLARGVASLVTSLLLGVTLASDADPATTAESASPRPPSGAGSRDAAGTTQPAKRGSASVTGGYFDAGEDADAEATRIAQRTADDATPELVAALVNGREHGMIEILRDGGEILIPLDRMGELLGLQVTYRHVVTEIRTPLGLRRVPNQALTARDGLLYVRAGYVQNELLSGVRFDDRSYALDFRPNWRGRVRTERVYDGPADVEPPKSTLAAIRTQVNHLESGGFSSTQGNVQLGGRLAQGTWTVVANDATDDQFEAREYNWYRTDGSRHWLLGRQQVQPYSLLGNFDLTGVQFGWTKGGAAASPQAFGSNVLFPRRGAAMETVRGEARPGQFVQLRVDGRLLETEQVGYDGRFVFDSVRLPLRQVSEVEVLVFDPNNLQIPVEVRTDRVASSAFLLADGQVTHAAGIGLAGRFDEGFVGRSNEQLPQGAGGYYQWRQGFNKNITAEATVQHNGQNTSAAIGAVTRLAPMWVTSFGLIQSESSTGYNVDLEGYRKQWRFFGRSFYAPRAFGLVESDGGIIDHRVDVDYNFGQRLRLGVIARDRDDGTNADRFVLPTATWRPVPELYIDARPDLFGEYLLSSFWRPRRDTRLRFFRSRSSSAEVAHDIGDRMQIAWNTQFETVETRHTIFASRRGFLNRGSWFIRAGLTESEGEFGWLAGASTPLLPGVIGRVEYQSLPLTTVDGREEGRLLVNIVSDLRQAGGRVVPASNSGFRQTGGSLVGRITLDAKSRTNREQARRSLAGAQIRVADGGRAVTDNRGRFFIGNLSAGIYEVELDPADLPLELMPVRKKLRARIAPGAATRVDFVLSLEYGLAGRLRDADGAPLPQIRVELVDEDGIYYTHAWTDAFGLYRLDSVPPGRYRIQVIEGDFVVARREVEVVDDFLFGQDLQIGAAIERVRRVSPGDPRALSAKAPGG